MSETRALLTPSQVADLLNVDPRTVTRWAREGRIAFVRTPGGQHRFWRADIEHLLVRDTPTPEEQTA